MSITQTKNKLLLSILKNALHVVIYILLGLMLAFFINNTVYAAETDFEGSPYYNEETEFENDYVSEFTAFSENDGDSEYEPPTETILPTEPEPTPVPTPQLPIQTNEPINPLPTPEPTGRLLIHSRTEGTNLTLGGAVFAVHRTFDNAFIAELVSDMFGEAFIELPVGDYYLRRTAVPVGFILNTDRINFIIRANEIREITVLIRTEPVTTPPPVPNPGRLVIVNRAEGTGINLSNSAFAIYNAMTDMFIAEVYTNNFGEVSYNLTAGDYYIRQFSVMSGYLINTERISFNIRPDEVRTITVINRPAPAPTPPTTQPTEQPGRLVVIKLAEGTRERLPNAVFGVFNILTDIRVAEIRTDRHGEATVSLPAGDYYLREQTAPDGFIRSMERIPVRIRANAVTEIIVTNKPEETVIATPPASQSGRLLLFFQAENTRVKLQGGVFAVHEARFDTRISTLVTDQFGEATITLPEGDYYIRQIEAPSGFTLNTNRINVQIKGGEVREITIVAIAEPITEEPTPEAQPGRLLVTLRAEGTGVKLQGVVFSVHDALTDEIIGWLTTDQFGELSAQLPAGNYFIRQISHHDGYIMNTDRIPVRIADGAVTDITVTRQAVPPPTPEPTPAPTQRPAATNTPPAVIGQAPDNTPRNQGRIEIVTRTAGSGNLLSGGTYAIYHAHSNRRVVELTTAVGGLAHTTVEPGMYYIRELRPTFGYLLETERIFLEVGAGETVKMELTKERDWRITDLPPDGSGNGFIFITQTGQQFPTMNYVGGSLLIFISLIFSGLVLWEIILRRKMKARALYG